MIINHPNGSFFTLNELQRDVDASKKLYNVENDFSFTAATVQALINKLRELEEDKNILSDYINQVQ